MVTKTDGTWTVTTCDAEDTALVACFWTHAEALAQAMEWADEYRAAFVAANFRRAS